MHKIYLILLFILFTNFTYSQSYQDTVILDGKPGTLNLMNPEGNEFQLCFMQNYDDSNISNPAEALTLELFITGDYDANVTIEVKAIKFKKTIYVPAGTVKSVRLDQRAQITSFETIEKGKSVHITSDMPISVYGLSTRHETTDTYLGLPNNVIGDEYRVMCYHTSGPRMPQFAIVATEDSTEIFITPTVETKLKKPAKQPFKIILDKGDVYQVIPAENRTRNMDLTGSYIKSNKNISVFSGHQCAYVPVPPPQILACNHLAEQMPPLSSWGKHFFIGKLQKRTKYTYRVLADQEHTKIFINSKLRAILQPGQFYEGISDSTMQISADKPILVAQYSQGYRNGDLIGDPMMLLISPTQQFLKQYRFATPINGFWNHFINVVVPTKAIGSLRLNNKAIDTTKFKSLGLSRYSIGYLQVDFGTHFINCSEPFGMYSYGFGFGEDAYDAYGTMGGQSFVEYMPIPDTLHPNLDIDLISNTLELIARDDRINDSGIMSVNTLETNGLKVQISDYDEGLPQVSLEIIPDLQGASKYGRAVLSIEDMAGNEALYTICYNPTAENQSDIFQLTPGLTESCMPSGALYLGVFGKFSSIFHSADFYSMGDLNALGKFSDAIGFGGYFGVEVSKDISKNFNIAGRLSYENIGGVITSPDSILQAVRDPLTGGLLDFQEVYDLNLDGKFISLAISAQWKLSKYYYLTGGFNLAMALFDSPRLTRRISYPSNYVYNNGSSELYLDDVNLSEDFNSILPSLFGGMGLNISLHPYIFAFSEINYNYYLSSINSAGNWNVNNISLLIGLKFNSNFLFR